MCLFIYGVERDAFLTFTKQEDRIAFIVRKGFSDALIVSQRRLNGVVALGGSSLTKALRKRY